MTLWPMTVIRRRPRASIDKLQQLATQKKKTVTHTEDDKVEKHIPCSLLSSTLHQQYQFFIFLS